MNQNKRKFKGVLSGFMATALTASLLPMPEAKANNFYDVYNAWYVDSVNRWASAEVVSGKGDNLFAPDDTIKRAEIAVMLNNLMGYEVLSETLFSDLLNSSSWYYSPLRKLNAAGVMNGTSTTEMGPEVYVNRQSAAVMLAKAFHLEPSTATASSFADNAKIAAYAMGSVITLSDMGIITGRGDNMFYPEENVTRAEFAGMLNAMVGTYVAKSGTSTHATNPNGTMLINTPTSVSNRTIYGDLILAEGIQDGNVYLEDVSVTGNIVVKGGGVNSIYLKNVTVGDQLIVGRAADDVRVVISGDTTVSTVKIQDNSTIDATEMTTEGAIGDVTIESAERVTLLGAFDSLTNESTGVELTLQGSIAEINMNASGTINGAFVSAGTSFDSNSIPNVEMDQPEITLTHNYGTAADEEDNDPYAESAVMSTEYDPETGEVVTVIRVEDEEDCVLMAEAKNAITVYNPNDLSSLNSLVLEVEQESYSSYTEYTVTFTIAQNYNEIPLSINFKDEYAAPELNITANFNSLPNATADIEIVDLELKASTNQATATVEVSNIKYCEPHFDETFIFTYADDLELELEITDSEYDADESTAYYDIKFSADAVDSLDMTMNFLKTDAQDEIPDVEALLYHVENEADIWELQVDSVLNAQGMMEVKITIDNLGDYALVSSLSKAVTILAESDEEHYGYGLDFDVELIHEGALSYYNITFAPSTKVEEVVFQVNVEDINENIPTMAESVTLPRISTTDYSKYIQINMNTRTYSRSQVTVEVAVDLEKIEELTGYEIDSREPIIPVLGSVSSYNTTEDSEVEEISDYTVTKLEDGLYSVKFTPAMRVNGDDTEPLPTLLCLNLVQEDDYLALFPVSNLGATSTSNIVREENLAYAVKASKYSKRSSDNDETPSYDYTVKFTVVAESGKTFSTTNIGIRPKVELEGEEEYDIDNYVTNWRVASSKEDTQYADNLSKYTVEVDLDTYIRINPEDLALNITGVSSVDLSGQDGVDVADPFIAPTISFASNSDFSGVEFTANDFNADTGKVTLNFNLSNATEQKYQFTSKITSSNEEVEGFATEFNANTGYTVSFTLPEALRDTATTITLTPTHVDDLFKTPLTVPTSGKVGTTTVTDVTNGGANRTKAEFVTGTATATYTMTVTVPDTYTLKDATKVVENFNFSANSGYEVTKVDASGTTYTVEFETSTSNLSTTAPTLTVDLLYATPKEADFTLSVDGSGFEVDGNTIKRLSGELTWEYSTTDETVLPQDGISYGFTNKTGGDIYFSVDESTWVKTATNAAYKISVDNLEADKIYVSYDPKGSNPTTLNVAFEIRGSQNDIFELNNDAASAMASASISLTAAEEEDNADSGSQNWSKLIATARDFYDFQHFTIKDGSYIDGKFRIYSGQTVHVAKDNGIKMNLDGEIEENVDGTFTYPDAIGTVLLMNDAMIQFDDKLYKSTKTSDDGQEVPMGFAIIDAANIASKVTKKYLDEVSE